MIVERANRAQNNALAVLFRRGAALRGLGYTHADGSPCTYPSSDPYCFGEVPYMDSPAYVSQVNKEIGQDIANTGPGGPTAQFEAAYGQYPQNVQNALLDCILARANAQEFNIGIPDKCKMTDAQIVAANMPAVVTPGNAPNVLPTLAPAPVLSSPVAPSQLSQALLQAASPAPGTNSSTQPGTVAATVTAADTPPKRSASPSASAAPSGLTPQQYGSVYALTARIENLTRGTSNLFQVGDVYRVTVTGTPNQPVSVVAAQNGLSSSSPYGNTDANGNFSITGTIDTASIGNWTEQWFVGNSSAGSFAFSVTANTSQGSSQPGTYYDGGTPYATETPNPIAAGAASSCFELFGDAATGGHETCIGPVGNLTALLGVGLVLYALSRGGRSR